MIEFESGIPTNPKDLQKQLISIYRSLPTRDVVTVPELRNPDTSRFRKRKLVEEKYERDKKRRRSELPGRKLIHLSLILEKAGITPLFKNSIYDAFEENFFRGLQNGFDETIDLLGVDEGMSFDEGIFSADPAMRMKIERRFHQSLLNDLEFYKNPPAHIGGESLEEEIVESQLKLANFEEQFFVLYGEPASTLQAPIY